MFRMELGMKGGFSFSRMAGSLVLKSFLKRAVVLTIKEKARLRSRTMPAIWAWIFALRPLRTLGLSRTLISSFMVLLDRSAAGRIFLRVL